MSSSCPYKLNEMCSLFPHLRRRLARIVPRSRGTISYSFIWSPFPSLVINIKLINFGKLENRHKSKKRWNERNKYYVIFDSQSLWIEHSLETFFLLDQFFSPRSNFYSLFFFFLFRSIFFFFFFNKPALINTLVRIFDGSLNVSILGTAVGPPVYECQAKPANWEISSKILGLGKWSGGRHSVHAALARFSSRSLRRKASSKWRSYVPKTLNRNRALKPFQVRSVNSWIYYNSWILFALFLFLTN